MVEIRYTGDAVKPSGNTLREWLINRLVSDAHPPSQFSLMPGVLESKRATIKLKKNILLKNQISYRVKF